MTTQSYLDQILGVDLVESADQIREEEVRWLWPGRIPLGKLTVLDGDPGLGKSLISLDLAARVSQRGVMPDGAVGVNGCVLICSAEDDSADTIVPRLRHAGADLARVKLMATLPDGDGSRRDLFVPEDAVSLEQAIIAHQVIFVVVDPLMAFLGEEVRSNSDQSVRRVLRLLAGIAQKHGCAILVIRHLNKSNGSSPIYRGGGSIGIIGAARAGLMVAIDPNDDQDRVLAGTKMNLATMPPSLIYRIGGSKGIIEVLWGGSSEHTARSLLDGQGLDDEERSKLAEAAQFLADLVGQGPVPAEEVLRQARRLGYSEKTLYRAKSQLKIVSRKDRTSIRGKWSWALPDLYMVTSGERRLGRIDHLSPLDGQDGQSGVHESGHLRPGEDWEESLFNVGHVLDTVD